MRSFSDAAKKILLQPRAWRGNTAELRMAVQRAALSTDLPIVIERDLEPELDGEVLADVPAGIPEPVLGKGFRADDYLDAVRENLVARAMAEARGNRRIASELLGVPPSRVRDWVKEIEDG